jgi:hypothetical protein
VLREAQAVMREVLEGGDLLVVSTRIRAYLRTAPLADQALEAVRAAAISAPALAVPPDVPTAASLLPAALVAAGGLVPVPAVAGMAVRLATETAERFAASLDAARDRV